MRRFAILFALALATAMPALGWTEPPMLTYKNTVLMEGKSEDAIWNIAWTWMDNQVKSHDYYFYSADYLNRNLHVTLIDCPNFGVSPLLGGTNTNISFDFRIVARNGSYTAVVTNIDVYWNPHLGVLYGENGQLFPECYTKKMMKMAPPILDYISEYADNLFKEFEAYMKAE